jgi:hypothetical protein
VRFPRYLLERFPRRSQTSGVAGAAASSPPSPAALAFVTDRTGSTGRNWEHADDLQEIELFVASWAGWGDFVALWSQWRTRDDEGPEEAGGGQPVRLPNGPKTGPLGGRFTRMGPQPAILVSVNGRCITLALQGGDVILVCRLSRYGLIPSGVKAVLVSLPKTRRNERGSRGLHLSRGMEAAGGPDGGHRSPRRLSVVSDATAATPAEAAAVKASAVDGGRMVAGRPGPRRPPQERLHQHARSDNGAGPSFSIAGHSKSGTQSAVFLGEKSNPRGELSQGVDDASQRAA